MYKLHKHPKFLLINYFLLYICQQWCGNVKSFILHSSMLLPHTFSVHLLIYSEYPTYEMAYKRACKACETSTLETDEGEKRSENQKKAYAKSKAEDNFARGPRTK